MSDNAIIFSYDTRVNNIVLGTVIGIGLVLALLAFGLKYYNSRVTSEKIKWLLIVEYAVILVLLTAILREDPIFPEGFDKTFFSDKRGLIGNRLKESIANILMFAPFGGLLGWVSTRWYSRILLLLLGILFSFGIETLQYTLDKGVADVDDVACNALGLIGGFVLWSLLSSLYNLFMRP